MAQYQTDSHRADGSISSRAAANETRPTLRASAHVRDAWMWRRVDRTRVVRAIPYANLEPSAYSTSSNSGCDLICAYNWQKSKAAQIQVPGYAPVWKETTLPITIPQDRGTYFIDQNTARAPQYPFEPLFRATAIMKLNSSFSDIDVIVNRNSLRKLLDFCSGKNPRSFRINLLLIKNTLFIERCEKSLREYIGGSQQSGYGRNFEKEVTTFPAGVEDSAGYHRALRYKLGNLACVVQFEVDACYKGESPASPDLQSLIQQTARLSISKSLDNKGSEEINETSSNHQSFMPQSESAEIKTTAKPKGLNLYMPQLWFGRTPWLITGHHDKGTFHKVDITNAAERFINWEDNHQVQLKKLVAILAQFREAVQNNNGKNCIAIFDKGSHKKGIVIYPSTVNQKPLPDDLISNFWASTTAV